MNKDDILKSARTRLMEATDADQENREEALDDLENIAGFQWEEEERQRRYDNSRPCITINRLPQFVRQVTGDIRQLNPAINVMPADSAATPDVAEIIEGMTRHIEYRSDGSSVYERAAESAAQCGMGYFRILTEYESDDSFNQEILLQTIDNPFSVYMDPDARKSTREDANYCFITTQMSEEDFREAYPDATPADVDYDGNTDALEYWREAGEVVVAEYFWKQPYKKKIGLTREGEVIDEPQAFHDVVKTREVDAHKVMWAKISSHDILEGPTEYPCKYIPVVAVLGEEMHIGERRVRTSVIRFAKDPQRLYNYYSSSQVETIALQPKTPYVATAKQIQGYEADWAAANESNDAVLVYNPDEKAPGAPQRSMPPVASQALSQEAMKASEDMKATTGIYDAGLGQASNEKSGVAIRQRQLESDISTSIYTDNLSKAIGHCGRILVDMIPKIYDTQRTVRIVGKDETESMVQINDFGIDQDYNMMAINPLAQGKYDVRVSVGPNYTTRRQETAESMMQFVQAFPAAGQVAGDLIVKAMDWPDADKLAERMEKVLPPGMVDNSDDPEAMQQMAAQQQQAMMQQQQEQQFAQAMKQAELRKQEAEAIEAEAQAEEARFKAQEAQFKMLQAQNAAVVPTPLPMG